MSRSNLNFHSVKSKMWFVFVFSRCKKNCFFLILFFKQKAEDIELVTLYGFLTTVWQDEYRVWQDTFPYNCSTRAIIPATRVWIPDMVIKNSEQQFLPTDRSGEDVVVHNDGFATRSVSGTITFY